MFFEVLLFVFLGVFAGILFGLAPGVHPNLVVLLVPLFFGLGLNYILVVAFVVSMGIVNSVVDFIPSVLLGAPDDGSELSVLPGHRMLMAGYGYQAVKLCITGCFFSVILILLLFPPIVFAIPVLYGFAKSYIYIILLAISGILIMAATGWKKLVSLFCFAAAGIIGLLGGGLPIDSRFILLPVLSGLFGVSLLFLQIRKKSGVPKQHKKEEIISNGVPIKGTISGTLGGLISGILPGVGSSQIASMATIDKNEKTFLVSIGAITTANTIISIVAVWLIGNARSGLAIAINEVASVGLPEVLFILCVALLSVSVAVVFALGLARRAIKIIERVNYSRISVFIIFLLALLTVIFTGLYGLLLLVVCTALGVFANLANVRRGVLMGVLIVPTILFYLP